MGVRKNTSSIFSQQHGIPFLKYVCQPNPIGTLCWSSVHSASITCLLTFANMTLLQWVARSETAESCYVGLGEKQRVVRMGWEQNRVRWGGMLNRSANAMLHWEWRSIGWVFLQNMLILLTHTITMLCKQIFFNCVEKRNINMLIHQLHVGSQNDVNNKNE